MKLSKSFCGKNTATLLAATIALSSLQAAFAQSSADSTSTSASTSSSTTAAASAAPLPGDSSSSTTTTTTSTDTTVTPAVPGSDIPAGVLWTDPKYAVKEVPQPTKAPTKTQPTTGTAAATPATGTAVSATSYDETAARVFADAVSQPQYIWNQQTSSKKGKTSAANVSKELASYNRTIVEKFVANMSVPDSATLVENSSAMYVYLLSFSIDAKGNISKIKSESTFGPFTALHLADVNENAKMTSSVVQALSKCSPVPPLPTGVPPWYMLLRYEPNSGKVFVANCNTI